MEEKEEESIENQKTLFEELYDEIEKSIKTLLDSGITMENVKTLSELVDMHKDICNEEYWLRKENDSMNYGNYNGYGNYSGRGPGHGSYGEYNGYGNGSYGREQYGESYNAYNARGRDSKYRGYGHLDRMYNEYGRYSDEKEQYGANEDTKKSLKYMLESMEDFAHMLKEDAKSQEEVQMIRQTAQRIAQM